MSKILLIAATKAEMEPFLNRSGIGPESWQPFGKHRVWFSLTGVGAVASAFHIQRLIAGLSPDMVVQAGVCGAYPDSELELGETVQVVSERLADLGVMCGERFEDIFPDNRRLVNPHRFEGVDYPPATGFTVSTGCHPEIGRIREPAGGNAAVESMEGYSLFYCCTEMGVPFLELRTVSNYVSPDRSGWNLEQAVRNLGQAVFDTLGRL